MGANGASATSGSYSRRAFLGRVGAGVGAVVLGGRLFVPPVESAYTSTDPQHLRRMFPNLRTFSPASPGAAQSLEAGVTRAAFWTRRTS